MQHVTDATIKAIAPIANELGLPINVVMNVFSGTGVLEWMEKAEKYDAFREKRRSYVRKYRAKQKEG